MTRGRRPANRLLLALALTTGLVSGLAPTPAAADELAPDTIRVEGRGWGHGRGLSQWGSLGYAVDHGWTSDQILDHYYSNTSSTALEPQQLTVHVTSNDLQVLLVTSGVPFTVGEHAFEAGAHARLEVHGVDNFAVYSTAGCGDPGTAIATGMTGTPGQNGHPYLEASPTDVDPAVDDVAQMLTMVTCDEDDPTQVASRRAYRGGLGRVEIGGSGFTYNRVPLEQYLRGVVPRESPAWWGALGDGRGVEALEAQSVAARSYAVALATAREARGFFTDACDTTACQVYGGAWLNGLPLDHGDIYVDSNRAILATAGLVRTFASGQVALTEFSASTGGWTAPLSEGNDFPAVEDVGDAIALNPHHPWNTTISRSAVEARYPSIGQLREIRVTKRNGLGHWGGRTRQILFVGTEGSVTLDIDNWGDDSFRRGFGLRSDWYRFPDFPEAGDPGFWVAKEDGTVLAFGSASHLGDASSVDLAAPVVDLAATPTGDGYWVVTEAGEVLAYGDASAEGNVAGLTLNEPIVGMAPHPSGDGYWLTASDGGIFAFGSAAFHGSMGEVQLNQPVVGIESTASGNGYWLVAADGGIFAFGDAQFYGSTGDIRLNQPITSMTAAPDGRGYWFVALDGGVFSFGSVDFFGSRGDRVNRRPITGMAVTTTGNGYWLIMDDGTSYPFGDAPDFVSSVAGPTVVTIEVAP